MFLDGNKYHLKNNYLCFLSDTALFYYFDVLLTAHLSIFISVINQLDAQNFCFTISLFHASICFEHMCSSSGGQNCNDTASGIITPVGVMMYSWPDDGCFTAGTCRLEVNYKVLSYY